MKRSPIRSKLALVLGILKLCGGLLLIFPVILGLLLSLIGFGVASVLTAVIGAFLLRMTQTTKP